MKRFFAFLLSFLGSSVVFIQLAFAAVNCDSDFTVASRIYKGDFNQVPMPSYFEFDEKPDWIRLYPKSNPNLTTYLLVRKSDISSITTEDGKLVTRSVLEENQKESKSQIYIFNVKSRATAYAVELSSDYEIEKSSLAEIDLVYPTSWIKKSFPETVSPESRIPLPSDGLRYAYCQTGVYVCTTTCQWCNDMEGCRCSDCAARCNWTFR